MVFLPIGIQTFRDIRTNDFVYIDKTASIHELVRPGKGYFFLSRPRRFGKSLLISTLDALFSGDATLFEGLAIHEAGYSFPKHPVLSFDFSKVPHRNEQELESGLLAILDRMAQAHNIDLAPDTPLSIRLQDLLNELGKQNQVVVLVDEYDKPIIEHVSDPDTAEKCRDVLRSFFGVLKASDDAVRLVMITGITRFARVSIFSEMNNLQDISQDRQFAALLGWTEEEIQMALADHMAAFATDLGITEKEMIGHLRDMYNGYRFTAGDVTVYNPWSILNALQTKELRNFWFDSGSSKFLMKILKERLTGPTPFSVAELYDYKVRSSMLPTFDVRNLNLETILFQAGYLTIKKTSGPFTALFYHLGFPNREVEQSLLHAALTYLSAADQTRADDSLDRLVTALAREDLETFFETLRDSFFANIPYDIQLAHEKYYQTVFHTIFILLNLRISAEERTNLGRIDHVIEMDDLIYIFEFKMSGAPEEALQQIEDKQYAQKFKGTGKKVYGIGVVFADRNIEAWAMQEKS